MSIRQGSNIISGSRKKELSLFAPQWYDYILKDASWIRADNFVWHSGSIYSVAYQHLLNDIDGKTQEQETIGNTTIYFYRADDGHKIVRNSQEENVQAIYENTGVAWYYVIDETNHKFKLPRTKFGFAGVRTSVGDYVEPGLPNITATLKPSSVNENYSAFASPSTADGAFELEKFGSNRTFTTASSNYDVYQLSLDASRSSSIYGNSTTVQAPATEMYLYFFVGNFAQAPVVNPISNVPGGEAVWGSITGTLSDQTDLQTALTGKQNTLTAGDHITINNNTISATYGSMSGATALVDGTSGLVPAPLAGDNDKFLRGDGTWSEANEYAMVITDYTAA